MFKSLAVVCRRFVRQRSGSVLPLLALSAFPLLGAIGVAVDYSRAAGVRTKLQTAIDSAVLAGARDGTAKWTLTAQNFFNAAELPFHATVTGVKFGNEGEKVYSGSASAVLNTHFGGFLGLSSMTVGVKAKAMVGGREDSCILTLDRGQPLSNVSMTFDGAPDVDLSRCGLRSNTSMRCNGHDTKASSSIAAGTTTQCSNPRSYSEVVADIFSPVAKEITKQCGAFAPGATWTPHTAPSALKTVSMPNYTAYHVCGDLTLSGSGVLAGLSAADNVIVIENGGLILDDKAAIDLRRTAIVLTGNNDHASTISFPSGDGKTATLSLSPPTTDGNPWRGISIFQDPALTKNVDHDWGPGTVLKVDGVVYLPNANVTIRGNSSSNISRCTKIVAGTFTLNGSVDLAQTDQGCKELGVSQWSDINVRLVE